MTSNLIKGSTSPDPINPQILDMNSKVSMLFASFRWPSLPRYPTVTSTWSPSYSCNKQRFYTFVLKIFKNKIPFQIISYRTDVDASASHHLNDSKICYGVERMCHFYYNSCNKLLNIGHKPTTIILNPDLYF